MPADLTPEKHPIINSPYAEPKRHWHLDDDGRALALLKQGRRVSKSRTIVPDIKRDQTALFPEKQYHDFINRVRAEVRKWREDNYPNLSRLSRDLLEHWQSPPEENGPAQRLFFAQLEAVETLMWLYEAPKAQTKSFQTALDKENGSHNEGCNRLAVSMATGAGKTMVMALLIAWHTVLTLHGGSKQQAQHAQTFVIITPGLTIKERLQELDPKAVNNLYAQQNLLPNKYKRDIQQAAVRIINFQSFRQRDLLEGSSADQKKMIARFKRRRGAAAAAPKEDYRSMLERVLNLPSGPQHRQVIVINDEAHHCYGEPPVESEREDEESRKEMQRAKQWFAVLAGLQRQGRLLVAHDLSATPYYVIDQGVRFSWILSDYNLHEAMEAGLVKIPRAPVADDSNAQDVRFRDLYKHTTPKALKRESIPLLLDNAMHALYDSYEQRVADWQKAGHERLPVLIVVANTISNATVLYDWIAGYKTEKNGKAQWVEGAFPLLSNVDGGHKRKDNPLTIIVHSEKLEYSDGGALSGIISDRMRLLAKEIATARGEAEKVEDKKQQDEYLRRILATVGKENEPGEKVRCVVSVGMLTEGWDARTVTHILGFRAFRSPLLCEQVAGRALRRVNYQSMEQFEGEDVLTAEYSEIIGIPFQFSAAEDFEPPPPPEKTIEVFTQPKHEAFRIAWPQVEMYRRKIHSGTIALNPQKVKEIDVSAPEQPTMTELAGTIGKTGILIREERKQRVHYAFARQALQRLSVTDEQAAADDGVPPNLRRFAQVLQALRAWVEHPNVTTLNGIPRMDEPALKAFLDACEIEGDSLQIAVDLAAPPLSDTAAIRFETSISGEMPGAKRGPVAYPPRTDNASRRAFCKRSELNVAVCDSGLELKIAAILDSQQLQGTVLAWARNLRLGWTIPWLNEEKGKWCDYIPDFVVRLADCPRTKQKRYVVLEGKGYNDPHWEEKRDTVLRYWLPGVNASEDDACAGKWLLLEVRPNNWKRDKNDLSEWICTVGKLAVKLEQLVDKEHEDV